MCIRDRVGAGLLGLRADVLGLVDRLLDRLAQGARLRGGNRRLGIGLDIVRRRFRRGTAGDEAGERQQGKGRQAAHDRAPRG